MKSISQIKHHNESPNPARVCSCGLLFTGLLTYMRWLSRIAPPSQLYAQTSKTKIVFIYICRLMFWVLLVLGINLPFRWRSFAWGSWRRSLWDAADCNDDNTPLLSTCRRLEITDPLRRANIQADDRSVYSLQSIHLAANPSLITVHLPAFTFVSFTVEYDFMFNKLGVFTNFPTRLLPGLSMYPRYPQANNTPRNLTYSYS